MTLRKLLLTDCTVTLEIEPEGDAPEGHFGATDEPEADAQMLAEIRARMRDGDEWAWFSAHVTVSFGSLRAEDYLGCCSYADEAEFKAPGGYYEDMTESCLASLQEQAEALFAQLSALQATVTSPVPPRERSADRARPRRLRGGHRAGRGASRRE